MTVRFNRRLSRSAKRRVREAQRSLPDFVDMLTIGVRAGLSPTDAFIEASRTVQGPLAPLMSQLVDRLQRGDRLADVLADLADVLGDEGRSLADTLGTASRYGLPIEPVLDRLVADSREARRRHAEEYARTLPIRLAFPLVTCTLPGFVLCAIVPAILGALSTLGELSPTTGAAMRLITGGSI